MGIGQGCEGKGAVDGDLEAAGRGQREELAGALAHFVGLHVVREVGAGEEDRARFRELERRDALDLAVSL